MINKTRFLARQSMRGSYNRVPLLAAIFMALLFAAMPGPAEAQGFGFPAPAGQQMSCAGMQGVQLCQCQMMNAHMKRAQDLTVANMKIIQNTNILSMKYVYCFNAILMPVIQFINTLTVTANGLNVLGAIIGLLIWTVLQQILNQVCALAAMAINSIINFVKNLICIPIPSFSLSLTGGLTGGFFKNGTCNGVNLFNLVNSLAMRPTTPSGWQLWNVQPGLTTPLGGQ